MQTDFCVSSCPQQLQSLCNGLCRYTNCFHVTFQANCPRRITPTPAFPVTSAVSHQHLTGHTVSLLMRGSTWQGLSSLLLKGVPSRVTSVLAFMCISSRALCCPVRSKTIYFVWCVYRSSLSIQKPSTLCGVYTGHPCPSKKHLPCVVCIRVIPVRPENIYLVCIRVISVRSKTIYLVWCVYGSSLSIQNHLSCVMYIQVILVRSKTIYLVWCVVVYMGRLCPFKKHLPCVVCTQVALVPL